MDDFPSLFNTGRVPLHPPGPDLGLEGAHPAAFAQKVLRIDVADQDRDLWCWAAVSIGVAVAYGDPSQQQCRLVSKILNDEGIVSVPCCPTPAHPMPVFACDCTHTLPEPLGDHFDGPGLTQAVHRNFGFLKQQIDDGHPVAVRLDQRGNGPGHFVVVSGYREGHTEEVHVCDSEGGTRKWGSYARFESNRCTFWDQSYRTRGAAAVPEE